MKIERLYLKDFRNISEQEITFSNRLNIFIGNNGQGKTNILEAIYFLLEKESFRYGENLTYIKNEKNKAYLSGAIKHRDFDYTVKMTLESKLKKYLINDKSSKDLERQLPSVVLFSPESLNIIKESADERRMLIDSVVKSVYKNNQNLITDFRRTLKTRNRLLKDIAEKKTDYQSGLETLESLNLIFLKLATNLTSVRIESLKNLRPYISKIIKEIDDKNAIEFDFQYLISDQNCENFEYEKLYEIMHKRMAELASAELSTGSSLVGPQKHDIRFLYNGKDSRFFCSQGQQRTIILAFKMAQIVYHHKVNENYPILLLDDVLSELDQSKQEALIRYLNAVETQTFLTTTDIEILSKLNIENKYKFEVRDGKII